ncbi:MAG: amidohydrolase family protein [Myxococcota bacterium]
MRQSRARVVCFPTLLHLSILPILSFGVSPVMAQHAEDACCFRHHIPVGVEGGPSSGSSSEPSDKGDKTPPWDVNASFGPSHDVSIDTDEGTWMSLDVRPDGKTLVFDLLGDLYSLPITGGDATPLTQGLAWDMQPRYSPDGRFIAFTSDRAGGDNIWVMNADGSNPQAVTQEDFRLFSSPAWSPDSLYVVARKHFTSERSLGAGELWLMHRTGGDGVQLTKRPTDQKDVGEPAFSPDGKFVYFSQDTTPGPFFEYNKDSNKGIYSILRLERETGELETLLAGPGGAIRPTPSPDGKQLAYLTRRQGKTVLMLYQLENGKKRTLLEGLERDMQETWAIHGVYPSMAWTPDGKSLVFWAGGKLQRIEVESRSVSTIPFRVRDRRTLIDAVRTPQEVAPERARTRMVRHVRVSPDGQQVVFQALGYLYIKRLPDGTPRRLTRQTRDFEFFPSWSADSKHIVYVSWNDETLGRIQKVSAQGGDGSPLLNTPGHYLEPVLSPDGKTLVYRKATGGYLVSPQYSERPGIYALSISQNPKSPTSSPVRVLPDGVSPHFGSRSDRIYLMKFGEKGTSQLVGIDLDGSDQRTYVTTEKATELRVSPDERWVAWREHFNAYLTPLVKTGQPVELGPRTKSLPIRRISKDSGEYLHWSGDSQKLFWTLGPELFEQPLQHAFAWMPGAPEKLPEPPTQGISLAVEFALDKPSSTVALVGGRIITLRGDEVLEDATLIVRENRIVAVGPRASTPVPAEAKVVDVSGKTLMPGLIDVHYHAGQGMNDIIPQQNWLDHASLAFGVTTSHDPSNDTSEVFAAAELSRAGLILSPRIFSTGTILYGAKSPYKAEISSLDDARMHLTRMKAAGAFSVKSYNQPRRNQRQQVLSAARELQMLVVPEGGSTFMHNLTMVVDGHTGVEHSIPVPSVYADVRQLWGASQVGYTPTLGVAYGGLNGEEYWYQESDVFAHPRLTRFVPQANLDARARRREKAPLEEYNHFNAAKVAAQLAQAGVKVNLGAHGQREGLAAHWELWMFVQGGMTPLQALRAGTLNGAWYLGMDKELGSLEVGKLADVLVLDANPLENIRHSEQIKYVMLNGRLYDAWTLHEVEGRQRKPFWFEQDQTTPAR